MEREVNREALIKKIKSAYKKQLNKLDESLRDAYEMLKRTGHKSPSDVAVAEIATVIFSLKMGMEQGIDRIDQMLAMEKIKKAMEAKQKKAEKENRKS